MGYGYYDDKEKLADVEYDNDRDARCVRKKQLWPISRNDVDDSYKGSIPRRQDNSAQEVENPPVKLVYRVEAAPVPRTGEYVSAHIYVGISLFQGGTLLRDVQDKDMRIRFMGEDLGLDWGGLDHANHLRYRIDTVDATNMEVLRSVVEARKSAIAIEWKEALRLIEEVKSSIFVDKWTQFED